METIRRRYLNLARCTALTAAALTGCADHGWPDAGQSAALVEADSDSHTGGQGRGGLAAAKRTFNAVLPGVTNERSCATCHVEAAAMSLSPTELSSRPADDPLFTAIDADDPAASPLTFNNLRAGLVRVTLDLPENVDLIAIPPEASLFTPPEVSAQILAQWQASLVPGARLGDPMPPDRDLGNGVVLHFQPEIITPADRRISVWRAVPSLANTVYTAPYQLDGREKSFEEQAFAALVAHGQLDPALTTPKDLQPQLAQLALFQSSLFSDRLRAPYVAEQIQKLDRYVDEDASPVRQDSAREGVRCHGRPAQPSRTPRKPCCDPQQPSRYCLSKIADPEVVFRYALVADMSPTQRESFRRGKTLYDDTCAGCHGSATDDRIIDRSLHDIFFELDTNGNLIFDPVDVGNGSQVFRPRALPRPDSEFVNLGSTFISQVGQIAGADRFPLFNNQHGVKLPRYRLRFYQKAARGVAARSVRVVDLPPLPVVSGGAPFSAAPDPNKPGAIIAGPGFAPQLFSTDPGRALISGDFAEFEGFGVPQLRGIATTAPYFHDNSQSDLVMLIDTYSKFILPFFPQFDALLPPVAPGVDRLSTQQKADLLTFLQVF